MRAGVIWPVRPIATTTAGWNIAPVTRSEGPGDHHAHYLTIGGFEFKLICAALLREGTGHMRAQQPPLEPPPLDLWPVSWAALELIVLVGCGRYRKGDAERATRG